LDERALVVGTVANVTPQKGIEYFVECASLLSVEFPTARFVVIGGVDGAHGKYVDRIQRLAEDYKLLPDRIMFAGSRSNVADLLPAFDLKVVSSVAEGVPTTAGEAMACGLPVVATDVGSVAEVVKNRETGFVVTPRSAPELANAIRQLLQHEELRTRMGFAGRQRAVDHFDVSVCADIHVRAYRSAIAYYSSRR
jgi:glycosyltransferase involved in cell wall biosynthesis